MSQQSVSAPTPSTDEEFTVQALTIHGAFFERKCQDIISQAQNWTLRETNYPVEHQGKASNLVIWAEKAEAAARLSFPIECKKNNPEFVDWVFFPQPAHSTEEVRWDLYPHVAAHAPAIAFIQWLALNNRRPKTIDAYARALDHFLQTFPESERLIESNDACSSKQRISDQSVGGKRATP